MAEPTIDPVTFAELREAVGAEFISELIDTFLEEAPTMMDALRDALAARDAERFRRAAHSLKSNANTFGAFPLGAMARELERNGLSTDVRAGAQSAASADAGADTAALDALASEYARVASTLKGLRNG